MRAIVAILRSVARLVGRRGGAGSRASSLLDPAAAAPSFLRQEDTSNVWLFHFARMGAFRRCRHTLIPFYAALLLSVCGCLFASGTVRAATCSGTTLSQALAQCETKLASFISAGGYNQAHNQGCARDGTNFSVSGTFTWVNSSGSTVTTRAGSTSFNCVDDPPPPNQCASHASPSGTIWAGNLTSSSKVCADSCEFAFTPSGVSVSAGGDGVSSGTWAPTGNTCSASDATPPPPANDPPPLCNGQSCYDPSANKFCSVGSSGQVCVDGPKDQGPSQPPKQDPVCGVNGATAECAHASGDPPPVPPNPPISDPPAQQTGSGAYTATTPGGSTGVTTGTYVGSTGGGTDPGDGTDPGGDDGGDDGDGDGKGCTAGALCKDAYTDASCEAQPATAGDPLLSQLAIEAHRQRCVHQGIVSELSTANRDSGPQGDAPDPSDLVDDGQGDGPIQLDDAGWLGGRGACPLRPIMYMDHDLVGGPGICDTASLLAGFVLAAAYVIAAFIIGKAVKGG